MKLNSINNMLCNLPRARYYKMSSVIDLIIAGYKKISLIEELTSSSRIRLSRYIIDNIKVYYGRRSRRGLTYPICYLVAKSYLVDRGLI